MQDSIETQVIVCTILTAASAGWEPTRQMVRCVLIRRRDVVHQRLPRLESVSIRSRPRRRAGHHAHEWLLPVACRELAAVSCRAAANPVDATPVPWLGGGGEAPEERCPGARRGRGSGRAGR